MNNIEYEKLKCIWMSSGVVDYKICDNDFDCENCTFDKAMKNGLKKTEDKSYSSQNLAETILDRIKQLEYDKKIIYLRNTLIVKNICEDTFYLGLNPVFECFLDSNSLILINEQISKINRGQSIMEILGEWGSVCISSPIDLWIYDRIQNVKSNLIYPYWYAIIGDRKHEIKNYSSSTINWENSYKKAIGIIEQIKTKYPIVGETMQDGGVIIKHLYQLIGSKKYLEILRILAS